MRDVIGVIPAGGYAARVSPLPCSKELYPLGLRSTKDGPRSRPKVVSHYLLEKMRTAGITKAYFVLRPGKWDIPAYFGDGTMVDMHLGYLILGLPFGVPFTLDQAYPFVKESTVAFGFPDILFDSADPFGLLLERQGRSGSDVTLGLCPATCPTSQEDRVDVNAAGDVAKIHLNPPESPLEYSWVVAVWMPRFTEFLHRYIHDRKTAGLETEVSAGHAIDAGIKAGLRVDSTVVSNSPYLDIGTPDGLRMALQRSAELL
jgi:glucose-1-phosphate thymidylyltransferase